jgi:iron complex outermembrane recepter protein
LDSTLYYVDDLPAFQIESYVRLDAHLGWRLTDHMQFELIGQNLLDDQHREFGAASEANAATIERSFFGRLSWRS